MSICKVLKTVSGIVSSQYNLAFDKYFLGINYIPGTVLSGQDTQVNKKEVSTLM